MAATQSAKEADLVERERETATLAALLAGALAGEGRVALIEGPAGIGKSRLLALARTVGGRGPVGRRVARRAVRARPRRRAGRARRRGAHTRVAGRTAAGLQGLPVEPTVALALRARAGGTLSEEDEGLFIAVVVIVLGMADSDEALAVADEMLERAHRRGSQFGMLGASLWRGWVHLLRGDLVDAAESLRSALDELAVWHGAAGGDIFAAAHYARTQLELGDVDSAWRALDPQLREQLSTSLEAARWWSAVECELLLASGRPEEVPAIAERMRLECPQVENPSACSWRSALARALHRLDRPDEALELARENLAIARRFGAPSAVGRALRELGELRGDDGLAELAEAVAVLEESPARLELAKACAALGRALRHARRPTDAREPLRRALELADVCGAAGLAEDVRTELYAAGARPRTAALSGAASLTASERRVAALAAEGSSNRDIAQALFVTPKTVEVHLSNACRKLGIRSRRELGAALAPG